MGGVSSPAPDRRPQLGHGGIGVTGLVFFVVAAASPLAVMAGVAPLAIARGGIGTPGAYALTAVVLAVFAVGYTAMSRHITNAGAFYAYVTHGLGRELGLGAALHVDLLLTRRSPSGSPRCSPCSRTRRSRTCSGSTSRGRPWFFVAVATARFLGHRSIEVSARVLGVALCLETAILLVVAGAVVVDRGGSGLSGEPFAPSPLRCRSGRGGNHCVGTHPRAGHHEAPRSGKSYAGVPPVEPSSGPRRSTPVAASRPRCVITRTVKRSIPSPARSQPGADATLQRR